MSYPVEVLRAARGLLADGGADAHRRRADTRSPSPPPRGEVERLFYGFSVFHCLPVGMIGEGAAGTRHRHPPDTVRRYAAEGAASRAARCCRSRTTSGVSTCCGLRPAVGQWRSRQSGGHSSLPRCQRSVERRPRAPCSARAVLAPHLHAVRGDAPRPSQLPGFGHERFARLSGRRVVDGDVESDADPAVAVAGDLEGGVGDGEARRRGRSRAHSSARRPERGRVRARPGSQSSTSTPTSRPKPMSRSTSSRRSRSSGGIELKSAAGGAGAAEDDLVGRDRVAAALLDVADDRLESLVRERLDLAAAVADEVVMVVVVRAQRLEAGDAVAEVERAAGDPSGRACRGRGRRVARPTGVPWRHELVVDLLRADDSTGCSSRKLDDTRGAARADSRRSAARRARAPTRVVAVTHHRADR